MPFSLSSPRVFRRHFARVSVGLLVYFAGGYALVGWFNEHFAHPLHAATALDRALPLIPAFVVFYLLGDVFVFGVLFVVRDRRTFDVAAIAMAMMLTVAFLTFLLFPIEMHKQIALGNDLFSRLTRFQQVTDTGFNTFPSLHVALNTFAYLVMVRERPRWRWRLLPVLVLIILSTLFVKQHLVVDVIGGLVLAACGYGAFLALLQREG